jgi:putative DNA primase/helicase
MSVNSEKDERRRELIERGFKFNAETGKINGFNPNVFAAFIKNNYNLIYTKEGSFYSYDNGKWTKENDNTVLVELRNILQAPCYGVWNLKREREYVEAIKRTVYYDGEMNPYRNYVNLINGMFDLNEFQLVEHHPEFYSTIQIPIEFTSDAKCPLFIRFLKQVFEGDKQRIALSQEWVGYLLSAEMKAQKALLLFGSGANGKGVFVDTISDLIGEDNISHIPLNELHKGFSRVCLYNKTANISSENETDGKGFNTQYFKGIVGEDIIHAEQKNKPVFSFKPTAKIVMAMNNLPYTRDKSQGYYRRLSMLHFSAFFNEEQRDKDLKQKLQEELPGIFLWALEGLKRLRENNYNFSECESTKKILSQYEKELNPILQFCEECIVAVENKSHREDNKVIYNTFRNWAESNGLKNYANISSQRFWREFEACTRSLGYKCEKGKSNALRYHTGIKVVGEYKVGSTVSTNIFEEELQSNQIEGESKDFPSIRLAERSKQDDANTSE